MTVDSFLKGSKVNGGHYANARGCNGAADFNFWKCGGANGCDGSCPGKGDYGYFNVRKATAMGRDYKYSQTGIKLYDGGWTGNQAFKISCKPGASTCRAELGGTTFHTKQWSVGMTIDSFLKGSKVNGGYYANGGGCRGDADFNFWKCGGARGCSGSCPGKGDYGNFMLKKGTAMASGYKYSQTGISSYDGNWLGSLVFKVTCSGASTCRAKLGGTVFHTKPWSAGMTVDSFLKGSKVNGGHYANGGACNGEADFNFWKCGGARGCSGSCPGKGDYGYFNLKKGTAMASDYKYSQTGIKLYDGGWTGNQAFEISCESAEAAGAGVCTAELGGTVFHTKAWQQGMTVDSFLKGSKVNGGHYANARGCNGAADFNFWKCGGANGCDGSCPGKGDYGYFNVRKATAMGSDYKYSQTGIQTYKQGTWSGSQAFKIGCEPAKAAKAAEAATGVC